MKIKKFNESVEINYYDAFNMYIKGRKVLDTYYVPPYGNLSLEIGKRFWGKGMIVEGGYKILFHGGGCSGEDCNVSFIVSPDNEYIASIDW